MWCFKVVEETGRIVSGGRAKTSVCSSKPQLQGYLNLTTQSSDTPKYMHKQATPTNLLIAISFLDNLGLITWSKMFSYVKNMFMLVLYVLVSVWVLPKFRLQHIGKGQRSYCFLHAQMFCRCICAFSPSFAAHRSSFVKIGWISCTVLSSWLTNITHNLAWIWFLCHSVMLAFPNISCRYVDE